MSKKSFTYYIVHNREQFDRAVALLGGLPRKPLYDFPMKVGHDGKVFQDAGDDLIPEYFHAPSGIIYDYTLAELP